MHRDFISAKGLESASNATSPLKTSHSAPQPTHFELFPQAPAWYTIVGTLRNEATLSLKYHCMYTIDKKIKLLVGAFSVCPGAGPQLNRESSVIVGKPVTRS